MYLLQCQDQKTVVFKKQLKRTPAPYTLASDRGIKVSLAIFTLCQHFFLSLELIIIIPSRVRDSFFIHEFWLHPSSSCPICRAEVQMPLNQLTLWQMLIGVSNISKKWYNQINENILKSLTHSLQMCNNYGILVF